MPCSSCSAPFSWGLDLLCTRREQPRVQASQTPAAPAPRSGAPDGSAGDRQPPASDGGLGPDSQAITERLQFRLPAVEVRKPAVMPSGSTLENLAAVVSESGVQGSKVSLGMLATPEVFRREWCGRGHSPATPLYRHQAAVKEEVLRTLRRSGLLSKLEEADARR